MLFCDLSFLMFFETVRFRSCDADFSPPFSAFFALVALYLFSQNAIEYCPEIMRLPQQVLRQTEYFREYF